MINKLQTFWFNLSDKLRFLLVGGFNFVVSYIIYSFVLYFILGDEYYQLALILAWVLSSIVSFTTQRVFVFPVKGNILKQYLKCCTTWVFSYIINAVLLEILVRKLAFNPYIGQIIAVGCCAVFTYIMFKIFAFRSEN